MNFTLPAHLRKKDEDTVAHLFEKEVEAEIVRLQGIYLDAAIAGGIESSEKLRGLFDHAAGICDSSLIVELVKTALLKDQQKLNYSMSMFLSEAIRTEAIHKVECGLRDMN